MSNNICPKCLKDDQVQKVSAIIAGGTFTTKYQVPAQGEIAGHKIYGSIEQTGTGISELAQRLNIDFSRIAQESYDYMKKNKTKDREKLTKGYREIDPPAKDSTISIVIVYVAYITFIGGVIASFFIAANAQDSTTATLVCNGSIVALIVLHVIAGKLNNQEVKEWVKRRKEYVSNHEKAVEENRIQSIQSAKRKYSNMYYCHRDDVVFVPDETNWASSSEIMNFVFR